MDKKIILAVAGSGKTKLIIDSLSIDKRSLIVTYTNSNFNTLYKRILEKFNGKWPNNIKLFTYFQFLYRFCYKPFLSDQVNAKGIVYKFNDNHFIKKEKPEFFLTPTRFLYFNRLSFLLCQENIIDDISKRIIKYYDEFIIDEVQDISGRDFDFLLEISKTDVNMIFVGDFYQHTYDTSRDGNVNKNLFKDLSKYIKKFTTNGFVDDSDSLVKSWRCSFSVCKYVLDNLGIKIYSNREINDDTNVIEIFDEGKKADILNDSSIIKLHHKNSFKFGIGHRNWGDVKGEEFNNDICVLLNKDTAKLHSKGKLKDLKPLTLNKLYVALTRTRGNVYVVYE